MRNRYLLLGVGAAVAVAVVIVVVGAMSGTSSGDSTPSAQQSLPAGHPSLNGDSATSAAAPTGSSVAQDITKLQQASKKKPGDVAALLKLGDAYFLAQRYAQAAKTFGQALRLKPADPAATVRLAMVWHAEGDTQRAVKAIQGVLQSRPNDQEAHYSMAIVYFSLARVQDARTEWAKAAQLDPTSVIGRRSQNFVDLIDGKSQQSSQGQGG